MFRANAGEVGGPFEGKRVVLLHHVGHRSGIAYVNPLVGATDGDAYLVCGADDPDWKRLHDSWAEYWPDAREYEKRGTRRFPVIRLEPLD
jgi:hypothetical protein